MRWHLLFTHRNARAAIDRFRNRLTRNHALADFRIWIFDQLTSDDVAAHRVRLRLLRLHTSRRLRLACIAALRATTSHATLSSLAHLRAWIVPRIVAIAALAHAFTERLRFAFAHVRQRFGFRQHLFGNLKFTQRFGEFSKPFAAALVAFTLLSFLRLT